MKSILTFLMITVVSFILALSYVGYAAVIMENLSITWTEFCIIWAVFQSVIATIYASGQAQKK